MTDAWLDVILVVLAVVGVVGVPVLAVTEHRREAPLQPIGDWRDETVRVPGLSMPAKRRVKGSGPERLRAGDISWLRHRDDSVSWQGQPIPTAPAQFTPYRAELPAPPAPTLPAFLWPDPDPTPLPATQPNPVYVVPTLRQEVA